MRRRRRRSCPSRRPCPPRSRPRRQPHRGAWPCRAPRERIHVVGDLPDRVGVVDGQLQAPVRPGRRPLQHREVTVGVAGRQNRALADVQVDRAGLLGSIVERHEIRALQQSGTVVAVVLELDLPHAADDPVRSDSEDGGRPHPHEVGTAAGEDPAVEPVRLERVDELDHRLEDHLRVRRAGDGMRGDGDPGLDGLGELVGRHRAVGELEELQHQPEPAGLQLLDRRRPAQLCRPGEGERQLGVERHLRRQGAVVVEHGDPIRLRHEVGRPRRGDGVDELDDRPLDGGVTPARELGRGHWWLKRTAASRSRSTYGSPLTSTATRWILPPENDQGPSPA